MSDLNIEIKMVDGSVKDLERYFDGTCEERESAGRHFKGNCVWEYDLTDDEEVDESCRGMYYLEGFADGDWGTTFDDYTFMSNSDIAANVAKAPKTLSITIYGSSKEEVANCIADTLESYEVVLKGCGYDYRMEIE